MIKQSWSADIDWDNLWPTLLTINRETQWEKLLQTLLQAFMNHSQAQQGWLLLATSGQDPCDSMKMVAQSWGDRTTLLPMLPASDRPAAILQRTKAIAGGSTLAIALCDRTDSPERIGDRPQGWICLDCLDLQRKEELQILAEAAAVAIAKLRPHTPQNSDSLATWTDTQVIEKLANSSPTLLYLFDLERQQNIYANQALTKILGYTPAEIHALGNNLFPNLMHPDDIIRLPLNYQRFNQAQDGDTIEFEYRLRHKNGQWRWLHSWDTILNRTEKGQPKQILGTAIDVTTLKQTERDLYQYERIVAATADAIALVDRNYCYQAVNPAYLKLHQIKPAKAIIGRPVSEYFGLDVFYHHIQPYLDRCLAGETVSYQEWFDFQAAGRLYISVTYSPLWESDRTISGAIASIRDITALKQQKIALRKAKEAAEAANRATNAFVAYMSHELRTPLHAISGFSQLLYRNHNLTPEQKENVAIIQNSGQHLLTLVEQVLEVSKIEAGHKPFKLYPFDLHSLLDDLEMSFRRRANRYNCHLIVTRSPDLPLEICTDVDKINQILVMLLDYSLEQQPQNGIKLHTVFTPEFLTTLTAPEGQYNCTISFEFDILHGQKPFKKSLLSKQLSEGATHYSDLDMGLNLTLARKLAAVIQGDFTIYKTDDCNQRLCLQLPAIATSHQIF
ncbi:MAG: PAS domain S-box protein [Jaaginema sp. PMC 1079.18]|nr:PAS domain S-box protein [Jaaginema sp. PMC 1080.18]MEC4849519.1 PAS domain S-box protein [Jaaginema sp. PMC 1079.18]MEC4865602.1 PAS domain S-box protein [Jaaginema sp. PMC 1078.18]